MSSRRPRTCLRAAWLVVATFLSGAGTAAGEPYVAAPPPRAREDAMPGGVPFEERLAEIRRRIQEVLVYPPLARRRAVEGESEIAFEIAPGGAPAGIELVRSSGSTLLDAAAQRAVRAAAPLPPVLGRLRVPVRFELDAFEPTVP